MAVIKILPLQIGITLSVGQYTVAPTFKSVGISPKPGVQLDINANSGPVPTPSSPSPNLIQLQFPSGRTLSVTSLNQAALLSNDTPWGLLSKLVAGSQTGLVHLEPGTPAQYFSWLGFQLNMTDPTTILLPAPTIGPAPLGPPVLGALTVTGAGALVATSTDSDDLPPNVQVPFPDLWTVATFAGLDPLQLLGLLGTAPNVTCGPLTP